MTFCNCLNQSCRSGGKLISINLISSFQITIKEEDRLAACISEIDRDVRIVPRSSYVKSPTGQIYSNRSFEGEFDVVVYNNSPYVYDNTSKTITLDLFFIKKKNSNTCVLKFLADNKENT